MSWFIGIVLDNTPWWVWLLVGLAILGATYSLWLPIWAALPTKVKAAIIILATGGLAYLAGRNRGAEGASQRERDRQRAAADAAIKQKKDIDNETSGMPDDALDRDNSKWLRK